MSKFEAPKTTDVEISYAKLHATTFAPGIGGIPETLTTGPGAPGKFTGLRMFLCNDLAIGPCLRLEEGKGGTALIPIHNVQVMVAKPK